ncbi:MAG TPA: type II toxin-antitoxin system MqsR family toxin [Gammaproteobacteria bacterium]|nr:type II toxin-antitoxin system MqsR family toxin [Gammaproteobacteria bacterium]
MIGKDKPSYHLALIKKTFSRINDLNMTFSAMTGQYDLGFSDQDVVDAIQALSSKDFYKSMPPKHVAFSGWHDVYKSHFNGRHVYIKFQIDKHGKVIISFKAVRN